jgi:hypothetical protein
MVLDRSVIQDMSEDEPIVYRIPRHRGPRYY